MKFFCSLLFSAVSSGRDGFPGTTEGSGDQGIQRFVMRAVCCGYFPIVLNPRGCAASPLTTPRH